ncbi:DUF2000 domain-containing protein [Catenulispora rubra]|uniref:DUF2000 domain-containing protein n=1 Tax=Catenulispora rubra TaxID=280293 RepID=UPI0018922194|nr:DUF2000 domain-containing protein [Catenulispora rubra]
MPSPENTLPRFEKCAIVIDDALPTGLAMNAAAVLALSIGDAYGETALGPEVKDRDGQVHAAITEVPLPILKADTQALHGIVAKALAEPDVFLVDFTSAAQAARDYGTYIESMEVTSAEDHVYVGVAVVGAKKAVQRLSGSLPLYR